MRPHKSIKIKFRALETVHPITDRLICTTKNTTEYPRYVPASLF